MKLLIVCDIGANRSVTLAHQLRFMGHDVLTAGVKTNSPETLYLLGERWADKVIFTAADQYRMIDPTPDFAPTVLWDIGPDVYPRPFNKELLKKVKQLVAQHRHELNTDN